MISAHDLGPWRPAPARWSPVAMGEKKDPPRAARIFGYLVAVVVNLAMLWIAWRVLDWGWLPFLTGEPFDYAAATMHDDVIRLIPAAMKRMASFQPPTDIIFIDRAIVGHYGNLRRVHSRCRVLDLVQPYLDVALATASSPP